ncbi:amidohydrolase family protein [Aliamphritea spongicola]|uniref:amidohydrolase family protein n=1 Tax=Aliamphritea spongicola TaxID=707589 RepID=UPI00196B2FA5|nr:amidohydrolase family protein [Aliamphritea spongicola]MBN3562810.1 amidohydrolase family protein [Aliamphritea spongicola]
MKIIDPHLHLFNLQEGEYHWLQPQNPPFWPDKASICRNFSAEDLRLPESLQLSGLIHIEAGFNNQSPWLETGWLESHLKGYRFRSIVCADLTLSTAAFAALLDQVEQHSSVAGIRHILDDEAEQLLRQPQVIHNLQQLAEREWIFECQYPLTDTPATRELEALLEVHPLQIIINHAGFPPANQANRQTWQENLQRLADYPSVSVKASGWEMQDRTFQPDQVSETVNILLEVFGERRVMLASNFPLCLFSREYAELWQMYQQLQLPEEVLQLLCHDNARRLYRLSD